jgi:hypothetical protein
VIEPGHFSVEIHAARRLRIENSCRKRLGSSA